MFRKLLRAALLIVVLAACSAPAPVDSTTNALENTTNAPQQAQVAAQPVEAEAAQVSLIITPQAARPTSAAAVNAPAASSAGSINPLTGLPVEDPATLSYAPALVSITNFPKTARPQAGLSFSPFVYEMYVGEGMSRFLAVFYGDYPEKAAGDDSALALSDDRIGPVRSGRLPYESLRKLYNGFLVMASASPNVKSSLSGFTNIWGSDTSDINSAMIPATKLQEIAAGSSLRIKDGALSGLEFEAAAPDGGKPATQVWLPYSYLNQIIWRYDTASGSYHRYQDDADGATFLQATDRLNGDPLTYENVVILFVNHNAERETLIDLDLLYINKAPALLFRDGEMHEIYWTTANGEYEKTTGLLRPIRFIDAQGNPFPLKPGQTWVQIVPSFTRYNETVTGETYMQLKRAVTPGSGSWAIHFYPPTPER